MKIAGFQKVSLIDFPGRISSVVFTQGCNFKCGYCHNPELVLPERFKNTIPIGKIYEYLLTRRGKIEGVVITGGEPTLCSDLPEVIRQIRSFGFLVKLDTNGSNPNMLKKILEEHLIDFVAMDIKSTFDNYAKICGADVNVENIKTSISIIQNSSIEKEFRTTIVKGFHTLDDIRFIEEYIDSKLTIQYFRYNKNHIDPTLSEINEFPKIFEGRL